MLTDLFTLDYKEECCICENARSKHFCTNCANSVCSSKACCEIFPHYNKTNLIICNDCVKYYESKLQPQIDLTKIEKIKQLASLKKNKLKREVIIQKIEDNITKIVSSKLTGC